MNLIECRRITRKGGRTCIYSLRSLLICQNITAEFAGQEALPRGTLLLRRLVLTRTLSGRDHRAGTLPETSALLRLSRHITEEDSLKNKRKGSPEGAAALAAIGTKELRGSLLRADKLPRTTLGDVEVVCKLSPRVRNDPFEL